LENQSDQEAVGGAELHQGTQVEEHLQVSEEMHQEAKTLSKFWSDRVEMEGNSESEHSSRKKKKKKKKKKEKKKKKKKKKEGLLKTKCPYGFLHKKGCTWSLI